MSAKSLLFQPGAVLVQPPECGPCRQEVVVRLKKNGRLYTITLRDKVVIEDPYLNMVKATAFAIREGEPYNGRSPPRSFRDFLVKSNVVI